MGVGEVIAGAWAAHSLAAGPRARAGGRQGRQRSGLFGGPAVGYRAESPIKFRPSLNFSFIYF